MSERARAPSPLGRLIRQWRGLRGLSQQGLALQADTTARHLSFVETGRSRPGRELVMRLADALTLPARERNAMLVAAGLAPDGPMHELGDDEMRPVADVLTHVLRQHEPYPAWVYARGLHVLSANAAAERLFPQLVGLAPEAIVDLWFAAPFRTIVENWIEVAWAGIDFLAREVRRTGDATVLRSLRRAEAHARRSKLKRPEPPRESLVICPRFNIDGRTIRTISSVMRFDTAIEVTASELRVELMFPGDESSAAFFRERAKVG